MLVLNAILTIDMLPTYRLKYIEQEMAKKRGRELGIVEEEVKPAEDDLYIIPEHLKVFYPLQPLQNNCLFFECGKTSAIQKVHYRVYLFYFFV